MNILIKYASRGRREQFFSGLQNIYSSIQTKDFLISVSLDADDESMNQQGVIERLTNSPNLVFKFGPSEGKIGAINRDINHLNYDWDLLINFSDDMRFVGFGWDAKMIELLKAVWPNSLDFFADFHDGFVERPLPTMSIMGREYYERFFYIYPSCYHSFSCDAEAMYVAQMLEKYHYFPQVLFKHELHPAYMGGTDTTYTMNSKYGEQDIKTYFTRMQKYFYVNNPKPHTINFSSHIRKQKELSGEAIKRT